MLYLISGVGFIADKTGIFPQKSAKKVIDLLFNIILPIAIVQTFMTMEYTPERVKGLFVAFACAVGTHLFGIAVSALTFRKEKVRLKEVFTIMQPFFQMQRFLRFRLQKALSETRAFSIAQFMLACLTLLHLPMEFLKSAVTRQKLILRRLF